MHRKVVITTVGFLVLASAALSGCGAKPEARTPAIDRAELVKSAGFDHGCPAEEIRVLATEQDFSAASHYLLDVCGERRTYKRVGMMYFDAR
jgi:hypothetical protein